MVTYLRLNAEAMNGCRALACVLERRGYNCTAELAWIRSIGEHRYYGFVEESKNY